MNTNEAKQIRIEEYLHSLGYDPVRKQGDSLWYKSPFRNEREPSFKVNTERNLWYDFSAGRGGNIIALALSAAEGDKYGAGEKRMQGSALSDRRQTILCRRLPQPFGRLRDTQQVFQRVHRTEGHHPHTAGTDEGDLLPLRGLHGLPLLPYPAAGKVSRPSRP